VDRVEVFINESYEIPPDFARQKLHTASVGRMYYVAYRAFPLKSRAIHLSGSISDSSLMPSGVISTAHDRIKGTGKPRIKRSTTRRIAQFGISKNGKTYVAI
jgi:hypothetical protein